MTSRQQNRGAGKSGEAAKGFTLIVANLGRLASVVIAVNETLIRTDQLRPLVMGVAALFWAGAQGLESFLDRLFGQ
jgi:hypothetical protein